MRTILLLSYMLSLALGCSSEPDTTTKTASGTRRPVAQVTSEPSNSGGDKTGESNDQERFPEDDESISPPKQVSGAYMTAAVLPDAGDKVIRVGVIGKLDDVRLSDEPEKYKSTWTLDFGQALPVVATLKKSQDRDYDQILEFFGDEAQFAQYAAYIEISLQFQQNLDGSIVSSVVDNNLAEILP